eukprot:m.209755 g.209755  ORF g.209755 m.209755 type:complete len:597 (+) comp33050_c1_seq6:89-1879(+)
MLICLIAFAVVEATAAVEVTTKQGVIKGTHSAVGVDRFAGIPFAVPPLGDLRFTRAVVNDKPWPGGILNASFPGPPCINNPLGDPRPPEDHEAPPPNEDCLQLNIWRPSPTTNTNANTNTQAGGSLETQANLPVMVWVFGGGLCSGFAGDSHFNGSKLAIHHQVIVVTVSYRLGALGFLATSEFEGGGSGGMNGFNDVIVAMKWLKSNVASFGGSSSDVTLFGQSSGGYTVCNLCVAPEAQSLFKRAIIMSGPCIQGPPNKGWGADNLVTGEKIAKEVMANVNVSTLEELRSVKAELIQWPSEYMDNLTLAPYFSGYFDDELIVPGNNAEVRWATGLINPEQIIFGHTSKDGTAAFYGSAPTLGMISPDANQTSPQDYTNAVVATWGKDLSQKLLKQYPLEAYGGSPQSAFIQSDADAFVICPSYSVGNYAVANGRSVWSYEFAHFQASTVHPKGWGCDNGVELDVAAGYNTEENKRWATHGSGFHFAFGNTDGPDGCGPPNMLTHCPFNPAEETLSQQMMAYWASFAKTGDPNNGCVFNGKKCVEWPQYGGPNGTTQLLVDGAVDAASLGPVKGMHASDCQFWKTVFSSSESVEL